MLSSFQLNGHSGRFPEGSEKFCVSSLFILYPISIIFISFFLHVETVTPLCCCLSVFHLPTLEGVGKLSRSALYTGLLSVHPTKGTGHNKFVRRGPTLSGVGGLSKTPPIS